MSGAPFLPFDEVAAERTFNDKKECSPKAYRIGLDALARIRESRERAERAEAERDRFHASRDEFREALIELQAALDEAEMRIPAVEAERDAALDLLRRWDGIDHGYSSPSLIKDTRAFLARVDSGGTP